MVAWNVTFVPEGTLEISPKQNLSEGVIYNITINGTRITEYKLSFMTNVTNLGIGAPDAGQAFAEYERALPLLKYLPVNTQKYIIGQRDKDHYAVYIKPLYFAEIDAIKKEAFAWFTDKGVDLTKVQIDFE